MANERILVVEDEGIVAMDIQARLMGLGYSVCGTAATGEDAVRIALQQVPDLVMMDIKLRGPMDGIQAAAEIGRQLDIPIVFLTAFADESTLQRAKVTGPGGYIIKPFEERELYTAIEIALYRHRMEQRLRESERWRSAILNSIGDAVIATDERDLIRFMNPVAEALTGWPQAEAIGRPLAEVFATEDLPEPGSEGSTETYLEARAIANRRLTTRNGKDVRISESRSPLMDDGEKSAGSVVVFRDETDRCRLEEELFRFQRLESVGLLAGGIAHDFNNLISGVLGYIELGKMHADPGGYVRQQLTYAEKASWQAKNLAQQLVSFAKGGPPKKKPANVGTLVRAATELALRDSSAYCVYDLPAELWPAEVDESQMGQVISNLVLNAQQAMPLGGRVTIACQNVSLDPADALPIKPGRHVRITVRDQGVGIEKKNLARIFDPYFTTKRDGTGLGLAVTYSIIRRHGGYITVQSEVGQGTTFQVYLPAAAAPVAPAKSETGPLAQGWGRILVMDDQESVRDVTREMLTAFGYEVTFAADGHQARDLFRITRASGRPIDLCILDVNVPGGVGGLETLKLLQEIDPDVKAIVASGSPDDPLLVRYRDHGFVGVVRKPFTIGRLLTSVREALGAQI